MFQNYFKTALRNLLRRKLFTGLNILGLSTGMACSILIFLWVRDEKSFDSFNVNADLLYRVTARLSDVEAAVVPPPLASAIKTGLPAVKSATRLVPLHKIITVGDKKFDEKNIYYTDTNFLRMFSYPLLKGDAQHLLTSPDAVVLTEATAIKYFGASESAIGKIIYIDDDIKGRNLVVTGVLKNIPPNSHLQFSLLLPISAYDRMGNAGVWDNYAAYVYFQLHDQFKRSPALTRSIEAQINNIKNNNDNSKTASLLSVQPLRDIHLHSHFMLDVEGQGSSSYVTIFSLIAAFILTIACINFMNLSTAQSPQRAKEVGLRKTVGAHRFQLVTQFISESVLLSLVSLFMAIVLAILFLPLFNELTSKSISINLLSPGMIGVLFGATVVVGLVSGSYPALFLSSFNPITVLKGIRVLSGSNPLLRNGLVVFQFAISVILMICTVVVYEQLRFIKNRDIGFDKENLLYVPMPGVGDLKENRVALGSQISRHPVMTNYTITDHLPTQLSAAGPLSWPDMLPGQQVIAARLRTDENFLKTFGIPLITGRFFSRDFNADDSSYVVNETALKVMKMSAAEALGKKIRINERDGTIIGVVKDFNFKPVQQPIQPLVMRNNFSGGYVVVRTAPGNIRQSINEIKQVFTSIYGDYPFSYGFIDEDLFKLYRSEQQMGKLFNVFSIISILIACLGLFGLTTYATQKRLKEIGVRKVLGATEKGIVVLLSKDFLKLVILALVIAFPAGAWLMSKWLNNFAYRIHISWWIFVVSGLSAVLIAFLTVSYQSIKAALANPVKSLRTE